MSWLQGEFAFVQLIMGPWSGSSMSPRSGVTTKRTTIDKALLTSLIPDWSQTSREHLFLVSRLKLFTSSLATQSPMQAPQSTELTKTCAFPGVILMPPDFHLFFCFCAISAHITGTCQTSFSQRSRTFILFPNKIRHKKKKLQIKLIGWWRERFKENSLKTNLKSTKVLGNTSTWMYRTLFHCLDKVKCEVAFLCRVNDISKERWKFPSKWFIFFFPQTIILHCDESDF